jgi:hypothetical protein
LVLAGSIPEVLWRSCSGSLCGRTRNGKVASAPISSKSDRNGLCEEQSEISETVAYISENYRCETEQQAHGCHVGKSWTGRL